MSLFSFFRKKSAVRKPIRKGRGQYRPFCEKLEDREVPTNDIFTVTGATGSQVTLNFDLKSRSTVFWDEIGVYKVADDSGRVGALLPGDAGYAKAALATAETAFVAGDFEGASKSLTFTAGTKLAFYMIQNNTLEVWQAKNTNNLQRTGLQAFFSIDAANRDRFDHVRTLTYGDRSEQLAFEDGYNGGDKDFNDYVVKVSYSTQDTSLVRGVTGQNITTHFVYDASITTFSHSEFGIFLVDDATGKIGSLNPGDAGYAKAALSSATRQTVFKVTDRPGATKDITLPAGKFFGMYLIQNSTSSFFLLANPTNKLNNGPLAFFSLSAVNPDGAANHVKWFTNTKFGFEDSTKPVYRDFNDMVISMTQQAPVNTAPTVKTPIADITNVTAATADRPIDLAGVFDDLDLANSRVRIDTNFGPINMELFDRQAPQTVANFYSYLLSGAYNNVIFHRSADAGGKPFVLQGGGFEFTAQDGTATGTAADDTLVIPDIDFTVGDRVSFVAGTGQTLPGGITAGTVYFVKTVNGHAITVSTTSSGAAVDITSDGTATAHHVALDPIADANTPTVKNEPDPVNRPNVRGTIAMAKTSDPNSATSQFFFNLNNNTTGGIVNLDDTNNSGGFTVFGRVLDPDSMHRIDQIAALATQNHGSPFNEIPLQNYTDHSTPGPDPFPGDTVLNNYFFIKGVTVISRPEALTYTATSSDPTVVSATVTDEHLKLDFLKGSTTPVTITVTATDKAGHHTSTTFKVTVNNTAPVANGDSFSATEDVALSVAAAGVLGNDTDADGNSLTAAIVSNAVHGNVVLNANGSFTYTPNANFNGVDSFTYQANDGHANSNVATVFINVAAVNDAPVAVADSFSTPQNTQLTVAAKGVLANDTDVENDVLHAELVSDVSHGSLTLNADGSFVYNPTTGFTGNDTFSYKVNDGQADSNTGIVTIQVG